MDFSGNGGNCKVIGGSIDIVVAVHSNTSIASLIDRRKLLCVGRFDRAHVGFEETGVEDLQQSVGHSRNDALALLIGSTSYNHHSTDITTTSNNGDDEGRVRFEKRVGRRGIFA